MTLEEAVETLIRAGLKARIRIPNRASGGTEAVDDSTFKNFFTLGLKEDQWELAIHPEKEKWYAHFEGELGVAVEIILNTYVHVLHVERRCRACGTGSIQAVAKPGRTTTFRGRDLPVPDHLLIPTCTTCGEEWMNQLEAISFEVHLDGVLARES